MTNRAPIQLRLDLAAAYMQSGKRGVLLSEGGTRNIMVHVTPETASDLATAALQSLQIQPNATSADGAIDPAQAGDKLIHLSATGWLDSQKAQHIPPGHSVLLLEVAGAQLQFSAPTEAWRGALEQLVAQSSKQTSN